jgi:DNA polymerase-3 subunit epsilon
MDIEEAKRLLNDHPDFKVISKISERKEFAEPEGKELLKGLIVDTETTGTNPNQDAIIELGMVLFEYDPLTGQAYRVLAVFDELEEPSFPIPEESTAIHGITDEMVSGKRIDDKKVSQLLDGVSIVIAHNSKFDRVFLEKRLPIFESIPWGCSLEQIDWKGEGLGSAKLDYIAFKYDLFYEAHRAQVDCFALLEILQKPLPKSDSLAMKSILDARPRKSYTAYAIGAAFDKKDLLKKRGYWWDSVKKCWHLTVDGDSAIKAEAEWLKADIYDGKSATIEIDVRNCLTRFSARSGNMIKKII